MTDLSYDKSIKVGDIVTSCFSGYWEVTEIIKRPPYTSGFLQGTTPCPLFIGKEVLKSDGTIAIKGAIRFERWDASHSVKITEDWIRESCNKEIDNIEIKRKISFIS